MSAVSTRTVYAVGLSFLLVLLITPMSTNQLADSTDTNNNHLHRIRHQLHRVPREADLSERMISDDRRTRGIQGGDGPKKLTATYRSSTIFIVSGRGAAPMFRAENSAKTDNNTFDEKTICMVDQRTNGWFNCSEAAPSENLDQIVVKSEDQTHTRVYSIHYNRVKYFMCADKKEKMVIPVREDDIKSRLDMEACVWNTTTSRGPPTNQYKHIHSFFPNKHPKGKCTNSECRLFMTLGNNPKNKSQLKVRLKTRRLSTFLPEPRDRRAMRRYNKEHDKFYIYHLTEQWQNWNELTTSSPSQTAKPTDTPRKKPRNRNKDQGLFAKDKSRGRKTKNKHNLLTPSDEAGLLSQMPPHRHTSILEGNH